MFKNRLLAVWRKLFRNTVYTIRHGLAKGLKRKGGFGFIPEFILPITKEEEYLMKLNLKNYIIYDIGGYEGVFALFFSRATGKNGKVITFEASLENYNKIVENLKLNMLENVQIKNIGIGKEKGSLKLIYSEEELGRGSMNESIQQDILRNKNVKSIIVDVFPLDDLISNDGLPKPDFVKIDVEGMELDVLKGMTGIIKKHHPSLFIEIHGIGDENKIINAKDIVRFLKEYNYDILHVESGEMIDNNNAQKAMIGRVHCNKAN